MANIEDDSPRAKMLNRRREIEWWAYTRYVMIATVLLLVLGIVLFFISFWTWICIKTPDQGLEPDSPYVSRGHTGVFAFVFQVNMSLLGVVLFFMFLMGVAQWKAMAVVEEDVANACIEKSPKAGEEAAFECVDAVVLPVQGEVTM